MEEHKVSAVYGVINFGGNDIKDRTGERIHAGYRQCRIDRHRQVVRKNVLMGVELQVFTAEDENEKWDAPIYDSEKHIVFAGEGILDNRTELADALDAQEDMSDVWIMYLGYLKWGRECIKHFRGIFSYAVYDMDRNEAVICVDYFANHCMYYFIRDHVLYFSTMLFPIIDGSGLNFEENERWLAECISVRGPAMMLEPRECAYRDVYKIPAGHCLTVSFDSVKEHCYWNPVQSAKYNPKISDEECRERVHRYLSDSVRECTRTNGKVAVSLSSGLDSTAIGCIAADVLSGRGEKLYSFTSVPLRESHLKNERGVIYDETPGVLASCRMYPNIEPAFIDCKGKNILTEAQVIMNAWELPCKSQQNGVWIGEIRRCAWEKGCRIMLTGATGNTTVSAGKTEDYIMDLVRHFHFIKANRDLKYALKKYRFGGRKRFFKIVARSYAKYYKGFFNKDTEKFYKDTVARADVGEKNGIGKRYFDRISQYRPFNTIKMMHEDTYILMACAQIGETETKNCLTYGIMDRDPMRNVRLIEFLCTLPMRCFANEKYDRRLIREFMEGIIPDSVRLDANRGRQSGDNAYRVSQSWNAMIGEIKRQLFSEKALQYLDKEKLQDTFSRLEGKSLEEYEMDMRMIVDAYLFVLFLNKLDQYTN